MQRVKIAEFLGIVNTLDPLQAPRGSLSSAKNVDIDSASSNGGAIRRRPGYTEVPSAFTTIYSAYSTEDEKHMYVIADGSLYSANDDLSFSELGTGFLAGDYYWEEVGPRIYLNGPTRGVIDAGQLRSWGVQSAVTPQVTVIPGSLPAGRYQVACVHRNQDGEEGGTHGSYVVEITDNQALNIQPPVIAGHDTVVYCSANNGETLYKAGVSTGSTVIVNDLLNLVSPMPKEQLGAIPPPDDTTFAAYYEGRMYVSLYDNVQDRSYVHKSRPFWLGLFNPFLDFEVIPGEVLLLYRTPSGVLIGTDREIFVYNEDSGLTRLADYGVPRGYQATRSPTGIVYFWTKRGLCRLPEFANLTEERFSVAPGTRCFAAFVQQEGYNKVIISTDNSGVANNPYS